VDDRCDKIIEEILLSEKNYVNYLNDLIEGFLDPLQTQHAERTSKIMPYISSIMEIKNTIYPHHEELMEKLETIAKIEDREKLFEELGHVFKNEVHPAFFFLFFSFFRSISCESIVNTSIIMKK